MADTTEPGDTTEPAEPADTSTADTSTAGTSTADGRPAGSRATEDQRMAYMADVDRRLW